MRKGSCTSWHSWQAISPMSIKFPNSNQDDSSSKFNQSNAGDGGFCLTVRRKILKTIKQLTQSFTANKIRCLAKRYPIWVSRGHSAINGADRRIKCDACFRLRKKPQKERKHKEVLMSSGRYACEIYARRKLDDESGSTAPRQCGQKIQLQIMCRHHNTGHNMMFVECVPPLPSSLLPTPYDSFVSWMQMCATYIVEQECVHLPCVM